MDGYFSEGFSLILYLHYKIYVILRLNKMIYEYHHVLAEHVMCYIMYAITHTIIQLISIDSYVFSR